MSTQMYLRAPLSTRNQPTQTLSVGDVLRLHVLRRAMKLRFESRFGIKACDGSYRLEGIYKQQWETVRMITCCKAVQSRVVIADYRTWSPETRAIFQDFVDEFDDLMDEKWRERARSLFRR